MTEVLWDELLEGVSYIRELYRKSRIPLKERQGLTVALETATEIAVSKGDFTRCTHSAIQSAEAALVVLELYRNLKTCIDAGLDIRNHLGQITFGSIDYGVPTDGKTIFFKDFEYEIFLAASLLRKGLSVTLLEVGDPLGEMSCEDVIIEAKHLNSPKKLKGLASKFDRNLTSAGKRGIFAIALEDLFAMGATSMFDSDDEYQVWLVETRQQMLELNASLLIHVEALTQITGVVFTQTKCVNIRGQISFSRLSNVTIYDQRIPSVVEKEAVVKVAETFNPHPVMFTDVWKTHFNT